MFGNATQTTRYITNGRAGASFGVSRPKTFGGGHTTRSARDRAGRRRWQMRHPWARRTVGPRAGASPPLGSTRPPYSVLAALFSHTAMQRGSSLRYKTTGGMLVCRPPVAPLRPVECPSSVQRMVTGLTMARIEALDVVPGAGQAPKLARAEDALRSKPRGSQQGQVSVWIQRFILRLAGYKILVGTGPSSRR